MKKLFLEQIFTTNKLKTSLILTFTIFSFNIFGQKYFIKESPLKVSELGDKESQEFARIQSNGMYSDHYLVEMGSLADTQSNGTVSLIIPQSECGPLTFRAKSVDYNNEKDYTWYGTFDSTLKAPVCGCELGSATILSSKYGKIGHITVGDQSYELLQLSEDKFLVGKVDSRKLSEKSCGFSHEVPIKSIENIQRTQSDPDCIVRCLVLYTPAALTFEGSVAAVNNRANLAIAQTNTILSNSAIYNLTIELADVIEYQFPGGEVESADPTEDANTLSQDPLVEGEGGLRDQTEADIVLLLTDANHSLNGSVTLDLETLIWLHPDQETAYGVVQTSTATGDDFIFAHELGHLFGSMHRDGRIFRTGDILPCIFGTRRRTIMQVGVGTIEHFSNPDVSFMGKATGTASKNCASIIRDNACTVAQFRDTVEPFAVTLSGDFFMCPCQGANLYANISGGTIGATYNYDWFTSNDGINWSFTNSSGSSTVVTVPCTAGNGVFVRVEVSDNFGNSDSFDRFIEAATSWAGQVGTCVPRLGKVSSDATLSVFPNPTNGQSLISIQVDKESAYTIFIKELNGRVLSTVTDGDILEVGTHSFPFNIAKSRNSLFYIHSIDKDGNIAIEKLLKL